ncbi:MAG: class I SAM-dependent methyltransferase [Alphaproteobacteria bacterium]|jgi:NADH dehydrogenase [ubiquinone] 1 alpha subcomplex assembly factor 7|nr:class I SAM-dependent methyltransferase [Alphaproteobacteria bacterium]
MSGDKPADTPADGPADSPADNGLTALLRARFESAGPMTVAEFMAEALSHPRYGYYATRDPFGLAGDFTTAPEISQMFGELIGLWCAQVWGQMGAPDPVRLVELGPGRGTLMADALRAAAVMPAFRTALRVHLVETSPVLTAAQQRTLARAGPPLAWHRALEEVPAGPMLLVANEVFDALPVRQLQRGQGGWHERLVDWDAEAGRFRLVLSQRPLIDDSLPDPAGLAPGTIIERCPAGEALAAALGARLVRDGGAALIIDYGHAASGPGETLQAVRGHAYADPLADPGKADLTAHVDFARLAEAARSAGAAIYGPAPQGPFLAALGLAMRAERLTAGATPAQAEDIRAALHRLTAPEQMGTLFKVMAMTAGRLPPPPGFADSAV